MSQIAPSNNQSNKRGLAITLASTLGIIAVVVSLFVYTMTQPRIMGVKDLVANGAITYEEPKQLRPFTLIDQNGRDFTQENFKGKWTVLFFGFSHCGGFCPTTLAMLKEFHQQLKPDITDQTQIVMVSVDPKRDTPERLKEYMQAFNPEFIGLTGLEGFIQLLSNQLFIAYERNTEESPDKNYQVPHGEQLVLINPNGDYHGFFKPPFSLGRLKTTYQSIVLQYQP